jgi:hypothetical protein
MILPAVVIAGHEEAALEHSMKLDARGLFADYWK